MLTNLNGEIIGSLSADETITGNLSPPVKVTGSVTSAPGRVEKDYNELENKPQIEGVTLQGNKTFHQLGLLEITPQEIDEIIYGGE